MNGSQVTVELKLKKRQSETQCPKALWKYIAKCFIDGSEEEKNKQGIKPN